MADNAPIPSNSDTRPPDIIREQSEKTASKDPVSATGVDLPKEAGPPQTTPPPFPDFQIPTAIQIPVNTTESAIYETAKAAVMDIFKNVTINGESPSSSGMGFNFSIQSAESAGEAFVRMNAQAVNELAKTVILPPDPIQQQSSSPQASSSPAESKPFDRTPQGGSHLPESNKADGSVLNQTAETSRAEGTHAMPGGVHSGGGKGEGGGETDGKEMMSKGRLHGESRLEHKERQETLKNLKDDPQAVGAIASGDTSYFYKGMIPILFTRADDQRDIIAYIEPINTKVVRGAASGERSGSILADNSYYTSEKKQLRHPWEIILKNRGPDNGGWKVGVENKSDVYDGVTWTKKTVSGLLSGPLDSDTGWTAPQEGYVYLHGIVNTSGVVTQIDLDWGETGLSNIERVKSASGKQTDFHFVLGYIWSETINGNTMWYVRQEAWRHLTLMYVVVNGVLCKVPFEM